MRIVFRFYLLHGGLIDLHAKTLSSAAGLMGPLPANPIEQ